MATRSRIAIVEPGEIRSVYCHNDGYPSHLGKMLREHYNTAEKARELIELGNLSAVYERANPLPVAFAAQNYSFAENYNPDGRLITTHSFDDPQEGVTIAYHRDRGEKPEIAPNYTEKGLLTLAQHSGAEYVYLWREDGWYISWTFKEFTKLTPEMVAEE